MKKMINIRNSVIIIMAVTVIFLVIGFIILSMELKKQNDEIKFKSIINCSKYLSNIKDIF